MTTFRVRYYYLATGMEGMADERDHGLVEAATAGDACEAVILRELPEDKFYGPNNSYSTRSFMRGCLSAAEEPPP